VVSSSAAGVPAATAATLNGVLGDAIVLHENEDQVVFPQHHGFIPNGRHLGTRNAHFSAFRS
jgi:hypothetical protein